MEKFTIGSVVLVSFPSSNFKGKKLRPALDLALVEFDNLILCQITSKPYSSNSAIRIASDDFKTGNLPVVSYIRPDKLFTADTSIVEGRAGMLIGEKITAVLQKVKALFASR